MGCLQNLLSSGKVGVDFGNAVRVYLVAEVDEYVGLVYLSHCAQTVCHLEVESRCHLMDEPVCVSESRRILIVFLQQVGSIVVVCFTILVGIWIVELYTYTWSIVFRRTHAVRYGKVGQ